jgi:ribosomal protein S18 acetylase RimI-like enzyme
MATRADLLVAPATADDEFGMARLMQERDGLSHNNAIARVRRWMAMPLDRHLSLVARMGGQFAGYGRVVLVDAAQPQNDGVEPPPTGWYLMGVIVDPSVRRRGIGLALTRQRLCWVAERATEAFFFANSLNRPSIDLHAGLGFKELRRDFQFPGATFSGGGIGILFRVDLTKGVPGE